MRTNGEFDREIDARRNNTALRTVASRNLAGKWFESPSIYNWGQQE